MSSVLSASADPHTSVQPAISAKSLTKRFNLPRETLFGPPRSVLAVDDVSFDIAAGTTFGLVGESGSGKTTVAKILLKLETPSSGHLYREGNDVFAQDAEGERIYRRNVQAVLQDPYGALSPRLSIGMIVAEPLLALGAADRRTALQEAGRMLELVGLSRQALDRYPHQFSGGQRQRVAIARALSVNPKVLVLDEPVSALDVSIRAQVLQLLKQMQAQFNMTYVFIGHDLATVRYMSDQVGVMYFGRMVEIGAAADLFRTPLHPYTQRLVRVASAQELVTTSTFVGELPNPLKPVSGCAFRTRCPYATGLCREEVPPLREGAAGHRAACHFFEEIAAGEKAQTGPLLQAA